MVTGGAGKADLPFISDLRQVELSPALFMSSLLLKHRRYVTLVFDDPERRITWVLLLIYLAASLFCAGRIHLFNEEAAVDFLSGVYSFNPVTCLKWSVSSGMR